MKCPNCKCKVKKGDQFCTNCGMTLNKASPGKRKKTAAITTVILLAVILLALLGFKGYRWFLHNKNSGEIYQVSFDCNAGTNEVSYAPDIQNVGYADTAKCPPYPVREDYKFSGWYIDANCTEQYDFSSKVTEDIVLYAAWVDIYSEEAIPTEEECLAFDELTQHMTEINAEFCDDNGYISLDDKEKFLDAIEEYIIEEQSTGVVTYYERSENTIYLECSSGLTAICVPPLEGYSSGGYTVTTLSIDPFKNSNNETMTNTAEQCSAYIDQALNGVVSQAFCNDEVTIEQLENLPSCEFFLWNGHGEFVTAMDDPVLISRESCGDIMYTLNWGDKNTCVNIFLKKTVELVAGDNFFWSITPRFVREEIELYDAMVYLSACQSGRNDNLAKAFEEAGAEVVFYNEGTSNVKTAYTQTMMQYIISYMSANEDGIFHTAAESVKLADKACDEILEGGLQKLIDEQGGTRTAYYGEGNYTLCSGIKGSVYSSDGSVDIRQVSAKLVPGTRLENLSEGEEFYFNLLEPGSYYIEFSYNGQTIKTVKDIEVVKHRFTDIGAIDLRAINVEVTVTEEGTGSAIAGAYVLYTPDGKTSEKKTDIDGKCIIETIQPGKYYFEISADGYESQSCEISIDKDYCFEVVLTKSTEEDETGVKYAGHRYQLFMTPMSWNEAKTYCESLGGHLVTITSEAEQTVIYNYIMGFGIDADIWIGITDSASEGDWSHWITGETVTYTNWGSGEPDDDNGRGQDYGIISTGYRSDTDYSIEPGQWDDLDNGDDTASGYFICEWDHTG